MVQLSTHDKEGSTMWTFRKMKAKVKVKVVAGHDADGNGSTQQPL